MPDPCCKAFSNSVDKICDSALRVTITHKPRSPLTSTERRASAKAGWNSRCKAAITEFYGALEGGSQETELLTLRVSGSSAAFHFRVVTPVGDQVYEVEPIDVMTFDDDGKILSMRAFWNQEDMITA